MTELIAFSADGLPAPAAPPPESPAPQLQWLDIALLRIDRGYQREIVKAGRANILKIAGAFDWRKFAPVIVAPVAGGLYAVVDGQHRTFAALLAGHSSVPCAIIHADRRMQAEAFAAVNGNVTRMSALSVFRAACGAGEPEACGLRDLAAARGVRILGYPVSVANMKPGDCTAPAALTSLRRRFGDVILAKAFRAVMAQGGPRGLINPNVMRGLCAALEKLPFALAEENVARVFAAVDIRDCQARAHKWGDELQDVILARLQAIARRASA